MDTKQQTVAPPSAPAPARLMVRVAPWAAACWALGTGTLAATWQRSDQDHPWGYPWRPGRTLGVMTELGRPAVAWLLLGLALAAFLGLALIRGASPRRLRWTGVAVAGVGGLVTVVVADAGGLALLGYLPMLVAHGLFGIGPDFEVSMDVLWPGLLSLVNTAGGLALVVTGMDVHGRGRGADQQAGSGECRRCGRDGQATTEPTQRAAVQRWARAATVVATVVPLVYAATRVAWAAGIPLGVDRTTFLAELGDGRWAGLGLATGAIAGAILTTGLIARWGEVFPRWVPWLGGRPVPVGMAVGPAVLVAAAVTSASLSFVLPVLTGRVAEFPGGPNDWATWLPILLWPFWGMALATAAMGYRLRRREPCPVCDSSRRAMAATSAAGITS